MRRRGLMRVVAVITALSVLTGGYGVQATDAADDSAQQTESTAPDTTEDTAQDDAAAGADSAETYVNERLESNYTNVSAGYTAQENAL